MSNYYKTGNRLPHIIDKMLKKRQNRNPNVLPKPVNDRVFNMNILDVYAA